MREIHTSVRNMVEFVFRSGDLDNRGRGSAEQAMQEGGRLHRMLQAKEGTAYQAEVGFKYIYNAGRYDIYLEGRADGIITNYVPKEWQSDFEQFPLLSPEYGIMKEPEPLTYVDEIKSTYRNVAHIREPERVHLAQAMCYAYMITERDELERVGVRMTYIQRGSREARYFHRTFSRSEITDWFMDTMKEYQRWTDYMYDWEELKLPSIRAVPFPYDYREGQKELASGVYRTIFHEKKLFLEAPTGTGKTLAVLYPSVKAVGQGLANMIFYVTGKTVTAAVAADSLELLRSNGLRFKDVMLTAREKICLNEVCDCNPSACPYAKGHFDRVNACLYDMITHEEYFHRDCIQEYAYRYQVCPHELSLDLTDFADAVIGDYNYVFDPHVYLQRFFGAAAGREKYILLVDEAHNLLDRARDMYSAVLVKERVLAARRLVREAAPYTVGRGGEESNLSLTEGSAEEAGASMTKRPLIKAASPLQERPVKEIDSPLEKHLNRLNKALLSLKKKSSSAGLTVLEEPEEVYQAVEKVTEDLDSWLAERDRHPMPRELLDFYFELSHFELIYRLLNEKYVVYGENRENGEFWLKLFNVDPSANLRECMDRCRSSILFSATFLPIQYYKELLGGTKEDYEVYAESCFSREKRALLVAKDVTSKYTRRNRGEYEKIAHYIQRTVTARQGNYMIFCPSYAYMQEIFHVYGELFGEDEEISCMVQSERMSEEERRGFLDRFRGNGAGQTDAPDQLCENGVIQEVTVGKGSLLGVCVLGGIFSEGIDLAGDSLIGAVIIGTGLPQVGQEKELLRRYFDEKGESGFDYAYRFPGMNKVMQAAGRVIRTRDDVGVVVLLDERFLQGQYRNLFPREWDNYQAVDLNTVQGKLERFWDGF
ncbi:MAG: ATP-dependent DNA helicase [Lachnospiraceae bacterium]|nr:ATP-dependent DNA helicase [Lachnospiraceae bacterium]